MKNQKSGKLTSDDNTINQSNIYSTLKMADRFPNLSESDLTTLLDQKNSDRMIKQLLNLVITKYLDLSVSRRSIICLSLWLWQIIIDLLTTDKSRYFA